MRRASDVNVKTTLKNLKVIIIFFHYEKRKFTELYILMRVL